MVTRGNLLYYAIMQKMNGEKLFWIGFTVVLSAALIYVAGYIIVREFGGQ